MRHTLRDVTFETPDDLPDRSEYMYSSSDPREMLRIDLVNEEPGDANALLATARASLESGLGGSRVYSSSATFTRPGPMSVPGAEGEWQHPNFGRTRFALAAIVSGAAKAVFFYSTPSRPDALSLFRRVMDGTFAFGEKGAEKRRVPSRWSRRQADQMLFALPDDWSGPSSLVFRSTIELRVRLSEPAVPDGVIDLSRDLDAEAPETVTKIKTEPVQAPALSGWAGEWRLSGGGRSPGDEKIVHKLSVTVAGGTVVTAYARGETKETAQLTKAWDTFRQSLRASRGTDG
jgi:hypothetical protein